MTLATGVSVVRILWLGKNLEHLSLMCTRETNMSNRHDCAEKQRIAAKFTGHTDPSLTPKPRQRVPNHRRSAS